MNKNQKIVLDYMKKIPWRPIEAIRVLCGRDEYDAIPADVSCALNNLTEKEQSEILIEFGKWGLKNEI